MDHEQEKTVCIRNLSYSRALLLKMRLEQDGIPCFLSNVQQAETGVDLHLPETFAAKAMAYSKTFLDTHGSEKQVLVDRLRRVRRILVPVDFSAHSIKAAHYALDLARTLKAGIRLLNVWSNSTSDGFVYNEMFAFQVNIGEILREMEAEAADKISEVAAQLMARIREEKIKGVEVDFDLVRGNAVDGILDIAGEYMPGLIVLGTKGSQREGLGFLGSNSAKLIEQSQVPILTVPAGYNTDGFFAPANIAYITRFDNTDLQAMRQLITFVKPFRVKVYCVHLQTEAAEAVERAQMKQYKEHFKDLYTNLQIECGMIEAVDPLEGIEDFVKEHKIDLLAITHKKRNLLTQFFRPSLTKKLLFQTDIPILVFRDEVLSG